MNFGVDFVDFGIVSAVCCDGYCRYSAVKLPIKQGAFSVGRYTINFWQFADAGVVSAFRGGHHQTLASLFVASFRQPAESFPLG